jgi:heptosyltransferase-2
MRTLILAPHSLRDAVLSQPLVAALSRLRVQEPIDVVARADIAPVYECMAGIGRVWSTDSLQGHRNAVGLLSLARQLRKADYRRAYILGDGSRAALLAWMAGVPLRIGHHRRGRWGLITELRTPPGASSHRGDRARIESFTHLAFDGLAPIGDSPPAPVLQRNPAREAEARQRGGLPAQGSALIVLCFDDQGHAARRWPTRHWAALIGIVRRQWPQAIMVALGDGSVRASATEAFALSGTTGRNLCGHLSQAHAIATVAQAQAVVGLDNTLMHVAAAFGRPIVSLFGPSDPRGHAPLGAPISVQWLKLECSRCDEPVIRHGHGQCMSELSPEVAAESLQTVLRRTSRNIR